MLILLPPSEAKAVPADGPELDLEALDLPGLTPMRAEVLEALASLCTGPDDRALSVLGLSAGQAGELERNRVLWTSPTLPAASVYTGVLYDTLGLPELLAAPDAAGRARRSLLIFSGLWGVLRIGDRIPPYRLAMSVKLPRVGPLAAFWRPALRGALAAEAEGELLVDLRSAPYAAAWRPGSDRLVAVRVLRERLVNGVPKRSVVSHMAKQTRGAVASALLRTGADPRTPKELAEALHDLGYRCELTDAPRPGAAHTLSVVLSE